MSDTRNLVSRLRTGDQYKHALEIMADDIGQWLRDEGLLGHDPFTHNIILGNGDYPTGREIIADAVRKMNEAAARIEELEAEVVTATEALEDIARQKRTDELETEYDVEVADFEGGYDAIIDVARAAIRAMKSTSQT